MGTLHGLAGIALGDAVGNGDDGVAVEVVVVLARPGGVDRNGHTAGSLDAVGKGAGVVSVGINRV